MKKSLKIMLLISVFGMLCGIISNKNAVFATIETSTGTISYTGTLSQFATQEKNNINTALENTYQRVYTKFQNSGLILMKTLNYQSLVCLGVMKQDDSLLNQMQRDRQELKLSFLKDFLAIESEIATLEEKNRIQGDTKISLFAYGTTYESEKARIAQKIVTTKNLHLGFVANFENTHIQKLQEFIKTVIEYSRENTGVINFINDKVSKMQSIDYSLVMLSSGVQKINTVLVGTGKDFLANAESIRTGFMNGFGARIQSLIDAAIKTYKKLPTLGAALVNEKGFAVLNYGLDFDEKMNVIMNDWYNKTDYEDIKSQIAKLKADFTSSGQLSCTKIYASPLVFESRVNTLLNKVNVLMSGLAVSLQTVQNTGSSQSVKMKLLAGFTDFNNKNLAKKIAEFRKIIRDKASEISKVQKATTGITSTNETTSTSTVSETIVPNTIPMVFTRPFKKGETGTAIKNLQILLKNNGYYNGVINGVFTTQTIEGIHQFQIKNGLLIGYEKKPATRGWMGPATRAKLNELAEIK